MVKTAKCRPDVHHTGLAATTARSNTPASHRSKLLLVTGSSLLLWSGSVAGSLAGD